MLENWIEDYRGIYRGLVGTNHPPPGIFPSERTPSTQETSLPLLRDEKGRFPVFRGKRGKVGGGWWLRIKIKR